jgi:hypothetical protein
VEYRPQESTLRGEPSTACSARPNGCTKKCSEYSNSDFQTEEREATGRRGREYVEKHHAIPVLADKLEQMLGEVVRSPQ